MLLETTVLLIQLGQSLGLLGLHAAVEPTLSVIVGLRHLQGSADVSDGLPLGEKLLRWLLLRRGLLLEPADNLLGCVAGSFHSGLIPRGQVILC